MMLFHLSRLTPNRGAPSATECLQPHTGFGSTTAVTRTSAVGPADIATLSARRIFWIVIRFAAAGLKVWLAV
jgi:hypothetical protein